MLDLLIRGAELVDGSGVPRQQADVGVRDGRIAAIGRLNERAERTIEGDGLILAPGFVDVHTHYDAQVFWDPSLSPSSLHGVTTVIGGNCGFSLAPLSDSAADYLMRMLARVEGMPLESLKAGVPWDWNTTAEFLDRLEGRLAINAGFMVGHSALRRVVMGEAATQRTSTPEELQQMCELLRLGLAAGGMGFSSTISKTHSDGNGDPVPSRHASVEELVTLAGVLRGAPGTSLEFLPSVSNYFSDETVDLMSSLSAAANRPLNWNLMRATAESLDDCLSKLAADDVARTRGGRIVALTMPQPAQTRFSFLSAFALDALPGWSHAMGLPPAEKLAHLRNPQKRKELFELAETEPPGSLRRVAKWEAHSIVETFSPDLKRFQNRVVADIAAEMGVSPFDALLDIVCSDNLRTTFTYADAPLTTRDWQACAQVCRDRRGLIGGSDAGAHLDMVSSFSYPTFVLATMVREQQVMTLEEAVQLMTDAPATLLGLRDRGRVVPGAVADLVLFDESSVAPEPVRTQFDLPAGAGRLYGGATGIAHVLVAGHEIATDGQLSGRRPGQILRSGRDTVTPPMS